MSTSYLAFEEMSINAWPALKTVVYDGWVIRFAEGYANRANSISPLYPCRIKLEEKIEYCEKLFKSHNLKPGYKLTSLDEHKALEQKLVELNYQKINETSMQVCEIKPDSLTANRSSSGSPGRIVIRDTFSSEWLESVIEFNRIEDRHVDTFKKIIGNIAVEKIVVHKELDGKIVGCGYGAMERSYAGIFDIVVKEEARRKGYGREIVEAIMAEAAKRGAKNSYLQVMISNSAALSLYKKIGYREIYRYWYRKKT